jgi:hypothetical protein
MSVLQERVSERRRELAELEEKRQRAEERSEL